MFRCVHNKYKADACTVLSAEETQNLLKSQSVNTEKMVPEGIWLVNALEPYGMSASNYKLMVKTEVVITRESECQQVIAVSFSDFFKCGRGILYFIHFYGIPRGVESLSLIKRHFLQHLLLVKKQKFTDTINIWLLVPHDAPLDRIKDFVFGEEQLGMQRSTPPNLDDGIYIDYYELDKDPYAAKM